MAAEASVNKNGVIITLSKANDGHGGEAFYRIFREQKDLNVMQHSFPHP